MADEFDRTEPATARRRQEARQEGNVARSGDLIAACVLLSGVILLYNFGLKLMSGMKLTMQSILGGSFTANPTRPDDLVPTLAYGVRIAVEAAGPLILCLTAVALLASVYQVGFYINFQALQPKFHKLSLVSGLRNIFDIRASIRLLMSLAKLSVIGTVAVWAVMADLPRIMTLSQLELLSLFSLSCEMIYSLALKLAILLLILGILDYYYQVWQRERGLRMTKQEVKDEYRRMEGDPLVKQRRFRVARQLALQRVRSAVPKADVVVTNPTHFAVALRYESKAMKAPKVVAKGADYLAMQIRQVAVLHGVPIVERKELARALYKSVEIGREIPPQFYGAVAEVLAYVYRLSGRKSA